MTVALAGRAPATFEIKSASLPLVALLLKSPDLALLAQELRDSGFDVVVGVDADADGPLPSSQAQSQSQGTR